MKDDYYRQVYRVKGLYVSCDGKNIKREYENKDMFNANSWHHLSIQTDHDGNQIIRTKDHGVLRVDELVGMCFCPPDKYRHKWYIIHKDRDKKNCHKDNLKWVPSYEYRSFYLSELTYTDKRTGEDFVWSDDDFYVSRSGRVQVGKKDCVIENVISDSDLGCMRAVTPFVRKDWNGNHYRVEELVANVFCKKLENVERQAILHIDYDMTNNRESNLKWVELDDPELKKFIEQREKDITATNLKYSTLP